MNVTPIDARQLIDEQRVGRTQIQVFCTLLLAFAIDGLDTQMTSYLAPTIVRGWHSTMVNIGLVFSAGLAGSALGALVFGTLGDVIGPKRVIALAALVMGIATIAMAFTTSIWQLATLRFVAGLGLGGTLPNIVALASQLAPKSKRATVVAVTMCGFPIGAALAGVLAAWLLVAHDWRTVYLITGALPLLLLPLILGVLVESLPKLLATPAGQGAARKVLRRLYPGNVALEPTTAHFIWPRSVGTDTKAPIAAIFRNGWASLSLLMAGVFVLSLMNLYFVSNWLPTLLQQAHSTARDSMLATTTLYVGGIAGTLVFGRIIDRFGFARTLIPSLTFAALCMLGLAQLKSGGAMLLLATSAAGFVISGGQGALYCLPALIYPDPLRATAAGWATGTGKLGSVIGPALAGLLLGAGWSAAQVLMLGALAPASAAILLVALALRTGARTTDAYNPV